MALDERAKAYVEKWAKATDGPWAMGRITLPDGTTSVIRKGDIEDSPDQILDVFGDINWNQVRQDPEVVAAAIVAARNDSVAIIEELQVQNAKLQAIVDEVYKEVVEPNSKSWIDHYTPKLADYLKEKEQST